MAGMETDGVTIVHNADAGQAFIRNGTDRPVTVDARRLGPQLAAFGGVTVEPGQSILLNGNVTITAAPGALDGFLRPG